MVIFNIIVAFIGIAIVFTLIDVMLGGGYHSGWRK